MNPRPSRAPHLLWTALATLLAAGSAPAQVQFVFGDVYLHSAYLPNGQGQTYQGIVRVDPATGAATPFVSLGFNRPGRVAFDPFRDRLLASFTGSPVGTWAFDGAGNQTPVASVSLECLAPRGDGVVYGFRDGVAPNYLPTIGLIDAGAQVHTLLDVGGSQPWLLSTTPVFVPSVAAMIYEASENALFLAVRGDNAAPGCGGTPSLDVSIRKLPLTSIGSALRAPATCTTFSVASGAASTAVETPLQWSRGPGGDLVLAVQTSASGAQPRLLRVTPATLAVQPFATTGPYPGDQALSCGAYVPSIGAALTWDGTVLRRFTNGQAGFGTVVGSYGTVGGAPGMFVVVGGTGRFASLRADRYEVSTSTGGVQQMVYVPGPSQAGNLYLIAGSLSGWTPGLPLGGGLVMPINYDAFTDLTIALAGSVVLPGTEGTVPTGGILAPQVVVPPGILAPFTGLTLHFAGVVASPGPNYIEVSNPIPLRLAP